MAMNRRLDKKEREERVLDLYYNQEKNYREIAKLERMCPRDISAIVNKESKDAESKQSLSKAAQAYEMFSQGKSPMEVAITLDLREPGVTKLYKESWNLRQIYDLNRIYLETNCNLGPFLNLYNLANAEGMKAEHVIWLLRTANKGLPELEDRYYKYKSKVDSLESKEQSQVRAIQDYTGQLIALGKSLDNYILRCEQEEKRLADLQRKRIKEENITRRFQNNNVEIRRTVEKKVRSLLSNRRCLLKLAALCITESIKGNPEKYRNLIPQDKSPRMNYTDPDFNPFWFYGQPYLHPQHQSKVYFMEDYVAMLSEDANKILEKMDKELGNQIIDECVATASSFPSLPLLPESKDIPAYERT